MAETEFAFHEFLRELLPRLVQLGETVGQERGHGNPRGGIGTGVFVHHRIDGSHQLQVQFSSGAIPLGRVAPARQVPRPGQPGKRVGGYPVRHPQHQVLHLPRQLTAGTQRRQPEPVGMPMLRAVAKSVTVPGQCLDPAALLPQVRVLLLGA